MVSWHLRCLEWTKMDQDIDPSATKAFPGTTRSHVSLQNIRKKSFVVRRSAGIELIVLMSFIFWVKNWSTPAVQGYWFDSSERCTRDPCVDNDRSTSLDLCCKPSQPCSSLTCPHGTLAALEDDWTRWLYSYCTPSIIIYPSQFCSIWESAVLTHPLFFFSPLFRSFLLLWWELLPKRERQSHFTQSCQEQDVPRSSLQDELSFINLCAVSVYLRCLDDWMTWVDAKSEAWVELLPTLRFYWTTHDLEFQILGIFHLPCTCILLGKMVKL